MTGELANDPREELAKIMEQGGVGEIQGVQFDLRHPSLDLAVYAAPHFDWQFYCLGFRYPWDEDRPDAKVTFVLAGDRVFFHEAKKFNRGDGPLADPHDGYELWLYVGIQRPNSRIDTFDEPIVFVPKDAMGPYSEYESIEHDEDYKVFIENHEITFKKIGIRIERLLKTEKLTGEKGLWLKLADDMLAQAVNESEHFNETLRVDPEALIDLVATAAYALAKAETATTLVPLAKQGLKARNNHMAATEAARRANMKADTPEMLSQAAAMCSAEPNLSLTTCAKRLADQFGRDPRNVRQSIKHLFESRHLPSGRIEYRPKRAEG